MHFLIIILALGGMTFVMAAIVYAIAGIRGEQGVNCGDEKKGGQGGGRGRS
jgi:hypothetical protein